jgi:hypothetical protein
MRTITEFKDDYIDNLENSGMLTKVDIIEQNLNAIDAAIEFAQRWINVYDDLPPNENPVICKDNNGNFEIGLMEQEDAIWKLPEYTEINHITHWRPIEII